MLVLGYVRVSSVEQEQGFGPQVQEEAIRAYAASLPNAQVEIIHESSSGESIAARVELRQVLQRSRLAQEAGGTAHVVMARLDRLARNLTDQEIVVGFALKHGFRFHSTVTAENETLDPAYAGDPMRVLIRQVFGAFAQLERSLIQGRLDAGLAAKAKAGGSTGGRVPFGYLSRDTDIIIDTDAAPIVVRVFDLAAQGLDQASIAAICARERPDRCAKWGKSNVSRMLSRRKLYRHGHYRSRAGVVEVARPELRILPERPMSDPPPAIVVNGPVAWERWPDPVAASSVSALLGRPMAWVQKQVSALALPVWWSKGRMFLSRDKARLLEHESVREREPQRV